MNEKHKYKYKGSFWNYCKWSRNQKNVSPTLFLHIVSYNCIKWLFYTLSTIGKCDDAASVFPFFHQSPEDYGINVKKKTAAKRSLDVKICKFK